MARRKDEGTIVGVESAEEKEGRGTDQSGAESAAETTGSDAPSAFSVVDRSAEDAPFASTVEVIEAKPKRGRPAGSTAPRVPKATPNEIAQAAPLIVGLSNQVVVTWMGPECAMLQTEANFLTPSVARILARLPRGAAAQVSLYTDPFIILTALGLWAARISRIKTEQARLKYAVAPYEAARAYGESGTEFTGDTPPIEPTAPIAQPDDESKNGQAKAVTSAILRTVSAT